MGKNNIIRQQHLLVYPSIVQTTDAVNVKRPRPTALFCYSICKAGQLTSIATLPCQKTNRYAVVGQIVIRFYLILLKKASQLIPNSRKQQITNSRLITKYLRKFGIKHCRYAFCCVALGWQESHFFTCPILFRGHGFLSQTRQLAIPSFAFSSFRECAF